MTKLSDLNIREGSNKEAVAKIFCDTKGDREACVKKGLKLGLQESTIRTWCSSWATGNVTNKGKKTAKKAAPKKAAAAKKAVAKKSAAPAKKAAAKPAKKREQLEASA